MKNDEMYFIHQNSQVLKSIIRICSEIIIKMEKDEQCLRQSAKILDE